MKRPIHKYNNGIQCFKDTIYEVALERYDTSINLHEPFEETVFDHILKNSEIKTFVDIGSAWGYYSLKAKFFDRSIKVLGICLLYTSPSPRDVEESRMPSSA